jgi:hypothetical protein
MKSKLIALISLLAVTSYSFAQKNNAWDKWNWLMGTWKGEGSGEPGKGGGTFSFATDLDKKITVRKSHSEYPGATKDTPKIVHDDLMVIYLDYSGTPSKAIYFDNEGHTINYSITYSEGNVVMLSEKIEHVPVFRLTYTLLAPNSINTKFEMSQDGETFVTYIEGKSKKTK